MWTSTRASSTGLLEQRVKPVLTLHHRDLPQELEDAGGWPSRDTAPRASTHRAVLSRGAALAAVHHLNLAHGLAGQAIRSVLPEAAVSITLNLHVTRPVDPDSEADRDAVRQVDAVANRALLGPILDGAYPDDLLADTAAVTNWSFEHDGDLRSTQMPLDVLGVNYYSTQLVRRWDGTAQRSAADGHGNSIGSPWVAADDVEFVQPPGRTRPWAGTSTRPV